MTRLLELGLKAGRVQAKTSLNTWSRSEFEKRRCMPLIFVPPACATAPRPCLNSGKRFAGASRSRVSRLHRSTENEKAFQCEAAHTSLPTEGANEQTGAALLLQSQGDRIRSSHPRFLLLNPGTIPLAGVLFGVQHGYRGTRWRKKPDSDFSSLSGSVPLRAGGAVRGNHMARPRGVSPWRNRKMLWGGRRGRGNFVACI
jgi:hypothetical protein